jgi:predicted ATPase
LYFILWLLHPLGSHLFVPGNQIKWIKSWKRGNVIISKISLCNWRNFRDVTVADMGLRVFLVGPNASGKSNFLDAMRFLRDLAKPGGGLQKAISDRGGLSKIRCLAARKEPQIEITVMLAEAVGAKPVWEYSVGIKQESRGKRQPVLTFEKVYKNEELLIDRPDKEDREDPLRLTQTFLEQINANQKFREVSEFFEEILYLHLIPQLVRHPEDFQGPKISDDVFGRSFLERVAKTSARTRKSRLDKIERALKVAVPQLKEFQLSRDDLGVPHLEATYTHWRPNAGKQREDQFSDGTLRLIGLLWSLLEGDSLLLLEEPEMSLHKGVVSRLPGLLWRLQDKKERQVIITTHSPDLLSAQGINAREVVLLTPTFEGTGAEKSSSRAEIVELLTAGMSLGDAVFPKAEPKKIQQLSLFDSCY